MDVPSVPTGTKTLQCPSCGLTLFDGHFTFPRCHRCNTLVRVCRYCVSYDSASPGCIEPTSAVDEVPDPDALTTCPLFKQSDAVVEHEPPLFQRRFFLYAAVGVAAVILIIALIQYLILAPMRAPAEGLEARVSMPDLVTTSTPSPIEVTVTNQDAGRALGFRVEFPAETLQRFTIVGSTPKAVTMEEHRGAQRLAFEPVPPMQYARVTIRIQGKRAGSKDFEMLVADERGRLITRHSQHKLDVEP